MADVDLEERVERLEEEVFDRPDAALLVDHSVPCVDIHLDGVLYESHAPLKDEARNYVHYDPMRDEVFVSRNRNALETVCLACVDTEVDTVEMVSHGTAASIRKD